MALSCGRKSPSPSMQWVTISAYANAAIAGTNANAHREVIMIHRYVFHNGRVVPIEQARLSPGQSGLLSGWGLFTTLRIFQSEPFAFERHWRRLEKDAGRTRVPFPFDPAEVRGHLRGLIERVMKSLTKALRGSMPSTTKLGSGRATDRFRKWTCSSTPPDCRRTANRCA